MPQPSIIEQRREQTFPVLAPPEVERLRRFGEVRHFRKGHLVVQAGKPTEGRSGSVKRVAAAVGEGSQVVSTLHAWLSTRDEEAVKAKEAVHA